MREGLLVLTQLHLHVACVLLAAGLLSATPSQKQRMASVMGAARGRERIKYTQSPRVAHFAFLTTFLQFVRGYCSRPLTCSIVLSNTVTRFN
jgi:hypothetical protein